MNERIEITKFLFEKANKMQLLLFFFMLIFIILNLTSLNNNTDLSRLRAEKEKLGEVIEYINSLNEDYISLCNISNNERNNIIKLNSYFKFLYYNNPATNKENLKGIIDFLQYVLNKESKKSTLYYPNVSKITINQLVIFSKKLKSYETYINLIPHNNKTLIEEIRNEDNLKEFNNRSNRFTDRDISKLLGSEDVFIAITDGFGFRLQKVSDLEDKFEIELNELAGYLFYTQDRFLELTLSQLNNIFKNYDKYINKLLENKMIEKRVIPIIELSFDKSIFNIVLLFLINIILISLIIEYIKIDKIGLTNIFHFNIIFNLLLILPKNIRFKFSIAKRIFLSLWSLFYIILPTLVIKLFFAQTENSITGIILIILFLVLFFFGTFFMRDIIVKYINKHES